VHGENVAESSRAHEHQYDDVLSHSLGRVHVSRIWSSNALNKAMALHSHVARAMSYSRLALPGHVLGYAHVSMRYRPDFSRLFTNSSPPSSPMLPIRQATVTKDRRTASGILSAEPHTWDYSRFRTLGSTDVSRISEKRQQHQCSESSGRAKNAMWDGMSTGETKESRMMRHWSGDIDFECEAKIGWKASCASKGARKPS
jgi:hypothetical protein